jgi:glycosyltransferase involved in cell wall biosynthesis
VSAEATGPTAAIDPSLVSVVVATNRGGPFLAETLDSVAAQTYPHLELVLVDDGSEKPVEIASITEGRKGVTVVRQPAGGVSTARNTGVAHTRGGLLVFLDDDDVWHPERIELQVAAMADPGIVLSYCGMRTVDESGVELVAADQQQVADVHEVLRRTMAIMVPNIMVRRSTFVRIGGFHPAFRRAQDLDLVIRLALEGSFAFVDRTLVDYRRHAGNNTRRYRELCRSIDHVVRLHAWAAAERGRDDLADDYRHSLARNRRYAAWRATTEARRSLRTGDVRAALGDVAWLARFAPTAPVDWLVERVGRRRSPGHVPSSAARHALHPATSPGAAPVLPAAQEVGR